MARLALLLLGTIVLGLLLWELGPADILRTCARLGWRAIPVLVLYAFYQAMRAVAFRLSLPNPRRFPLLDALWIRPSGDAVRALTFTGPFLGEPAKAYLLKRRGLTLTEGFAATLTAAIANLGIGAVMGAAGLAYLLHDAALPLPAAAGFSVSFFRRFRSLLVAGVGLAALDRLTRRRPGKMSSSSVPQPAEPE